MRSKPLAAILLAALLATAFFLPSCGGSDTPAKPDAGSAKGAADAPAVSGAVQAGSAEAETMAAKLLTPADVEKVSGLTGLKVVPKDPSVGAGGDVNIATATGQLVVMLNVGDGDFYELTKSGPNYRADHSGIGDESYVGPAKDVNVGPTDYLLGVKSGQWGLVVTSFFSAPPKADTPLLTVAQLEELARVAISRL